MKAYICDRCGKAIVPAEDVFACALYRKGKSFDQIDHADLCSDCFQFVKKIAFGKAKTDLEG